MTPTEEAEMHTLAKRLEELTRDPGWQAMRYAAIGDVMRKLSEYCAVCECQRKRKAVTK